MTSKAKKDSKVSKLERVVSDTNTTILNVIKDNIELENLLLEKIRDIESLQARVKSLEHHVRLIWDKIDPDIVKKVF